MQFNFILHTSISVVLSAHAATYEESIVLDISCYQSKYISNFKVEAAIDPQIAKDISCNDTNSERTSIIFDGLLCKTSYNISIYWKSPIIDKTLNVNCSLSRMELNTLLCKGALL